MDITRRRNLSAARPSPLLRYSNNFEDFGTFDEEECRFFLRDVGERVVPVYPFSFGMEEVYSLILERYGYAGLPDATSVLQDLLEDDGTAAGFGDDGDVWRSWRHNWRHRNNDALNPFIPKVGSFILQAPTLPHIRQIRALNFIQESQERERKDQDRERKDLERTIEDRRKRKALNKTSPKQRDFGSPASTPQKKVPKLNKETLHRLPSTKYSQKLPATTYSHQRTRTVLWSSYGSPTSEQTETPRPSMGEDSEPPKTCSGSSQQELSEVDLSLLGADVDPSLLITFEMLSAGEAALEGSVSTALRGGQGETVTLQQVSSHCRSSSDKISALPSSSPLPRIVSSPLRIDLPGTPRSRAKADAFARSSRIGSEPLRFMSKDEQAIPVEHDKSAERLRKLPDSFRPFARRPTGDSSEQSRRIRANNRQARILDGMILNPKVRKRLSSPPSAYPEEEINIEEKKRSVVRRSLTPVWQKRDSSRGSWMEIMRNFFRSEANTPTAKQSKREASNRSQSATTHSVVPSNLCSHDSPESTEPERCSYLTGLDGITDSKPTLPVSIMSRFNGVDHNKPLPLSPPGIVHILSDHAGFPPSVQSRTDNLTQINQVEPMELLKNDLGSMAAHAILRKQVPNKHQLLPIYQGREKASDGQAEEPKKMSQTPFFPSSYPIRGHQAQNPYMNPYLNPLVNTGSAPSPVLQSEPPLSAITYSSIANQNPFTSGETTFPASPVVAVPYPVWKDSTLDPTADSFSPVKKPVNEEDEQGNVNKEAARRGSPIKRLRGILKKPFSSKSRPVLAVSFAPLPRPHIVPVFPLRQAIILATLEATLVATTSTFLLQQKSMGRLDARTIASVAAARAGPPVSSFLYGAGAGAPWHQLPRWLRRRHGAPGARDGELGGDRGGVGGPACAVLGGRCPP